MSMRRRVKGLGWGPGAIGTGILRVALVYLGCLCCESIISNWLILKVNMLVATLISLKSYSFRVLQSNHLCIFLIKIYNVCYWGCICINVVHDNFQIFLIIIFHGGLINFLYLIINSCMGRTKALRCT